MLAALERAQHRPAVIAAVGAGAPLPGAVRFDELVTSGASVPERARTVYEETTRLYTSGTTGMPNRDHGRPAGARGLHALPGGPPRRSGTPSCARWTCPSTPEPPGARPPTTTSVSSGSTALRRRAGPGDRARTQGRHGGRRRRAHPTRHHPGEAGRAAPHPRAARRGGHRHRRQRQRPERRAAVCLVATPERAEALGLRPLVRLVSWGVAGVRPETTGIGPAPATAAALAPRRAGARRPRGHRAQRSLRLPGAGRDPAVGHRPGGRRPGQPQRLGYLAGPLVGATGVRILATLAREMDRRGARYGLETMCIGGGQGLAAVFERVT